MAENDDDATACKQLQRWKADMCPRDWVRCLPHLLPSILCYRPDSLHHRMSHVPTVWCDFTTARRFPSPPSPPSPPPADRGLTFCPFAMQLEQWDELRANGAFMQPKSD